MSQKIQQGKELKLMKEEVKSRARCDIDDKNKKTDPISDTSRKPKSMQRGTAR